MSAWRGNHREAARTRRPGSRAAVLGLIVAALWLWLVTVQFSEIPRSALYRDALSMLLWGAGCLAEYRLCVYGWHVAWQAPPRPPPQAGAAASV